ncbi:hypothetical protein SCHPADRAFT_947500 [Schizopora paradoxa]|uniref:Uncharacterized protein n=1 Tax=Schizopora paradoxa TaxID=27342 RepID=A0A0H2R0B8_9AGAM|nr:hypothetical protein SCHPADRAFT_947500 [Schizopora paradoxa]
MPILCPKEIKRESTTPDLHAGLVKFFPNPALMDLDINAKPDRRQSLRLINKAAKEKKEKKKDHVQDDDMDLVDAPPTPLPPLSNVLRDDEVDVEIWNGVFPHQHEYLFHNEQMDGNYSIAAEDGSDDEEMANKDEEVVVPGSPRHHVCVARLQERMLALPNAEVDITIADRTVVQTPYD